MQLTNRARPMVWASIVADCCEHLLMGRCRDTCARVLPMGASKAALISAACHFERFQALISVSAYAWPLSRLPIGAPNQGFTLPRNSLYMGKS